MDLKLSKVKIKYADGAVKEANLKIDLEEQVVGDEGANEVDLALATNDDIINYPLVSSENYADIATEAEVIEALNS